jgi:hypothetical protein
MNKKGTTSLRNEQEMAQQDSTMNESMRKQGTKMDYQRRQESFKMKKKRHSKASRRSSKGHNYAPLQMTRRLHNKTNGSTKTPR